MRIASPLLILFFVPALAAQTKREKRVVKFPSGETLLVVHGNNKKGEEHYDPNQAGTPLLDVGGMNSRKRLSKNFTVGELSRSGSKKFMHARIDPELVKCLQAIRDAVKKPVTITSGYRSFKYNQEVYAKRGKKATASRHISGQAADIKVTGMTGMEIAKIALKVYGKNIGVGIANSYAHIDVRGKWAKWTYFKGEANVKALKEITEYRGKLK